MRSPPQLAQEDLGLIAPLTNARLANKVAKLAPQPVYALPAAKGIS